MTIEKSTGSIDKTSDPEATPRNKPSEDSTDVHPEPVKDEEAIDISTADDIDIDKNNSDDDKEPGPLQPTTEK